MTTIARPKQEVEPERARPGVVRAPHRHREGGDADDQQQQQRVGGAGGRGREAHRPEPPGYRGAGPATAAAHSRCPGSPSPQGRHTGCAGESDDHHDGDPDRQAALSSSGVGAVRFPALLDPARPRQRVAPRRRLLAEADASTVACAFALRPAPTPCALALARLLSAGSPRQPVGLVGLVGRRPARARRHRSTPSSAGRGLLPVGAVVAFFGRRLRRGSGRLAADRRGAGPVAVPAVLPGEREEAAVGNLGPPDPRRSRRSTCPTSRRTRTDPSRHWSATFHARVAGRRAFTRQTKPGSRWRRSAGILPR